jgi:hypothetical protein
MPFETKRIADIVVMGAVPKNVNGYVNIRTNMTAMNAVVRVAVDISSRTLLCLVSKVAIDCLLF